MLLESPRRVFEMVIGSVSLVGLMYGGSVLISGGESKVPPEYGYRSLSLPHTLGVSHDWLAGWEGFDCEDSPVEKSTELSDMSEFIDPDVRNPEVSEFRIRLFGYLGESPEVMYCFFDTENDRWVRLLNGETDEDSQISLVDSLAGPIVLDLSDGNSYTVNRKLHQLIPVTNLEKVHAN
jgi:hypothetical protein